MVPRAECLNCHEFVAGQTDEDVFEAARQHHIESLQPERIARGQMEDIHQCRGFTVEDDDGHKFGYVTFAHGRFSDKLFLSDLK